MRIIFDAYDEDSSGEIDEIEMRRMLSSTLTIESKAPPPLPSRAPLSAPAPPPRAPAPPRRCRALPHISRAGSAQARRLSRAHASAAQSEKDATIAHTIALALTEIDTDGSGTINFEVRPRTRRRLATHACLCAVPPLCHNSAVALTSF